MEVVTVINSLDIMDDRTFVIKYNLAVDENANDDKMLFEYSLHYYKKLSLV